MELYDQTEAAISVAVIVQSPPLVPLYEAPAIIDLGRQGDYMPEA